MQLLGRTVWQFLKWLYIGYHNSETPLLGIHPREALHSFWNPKENPFPAFAACRAACIVGFWVLFKSQRSSTFECLSLGFCHHSSFKLTSGLSFCTFSKEPEILINRFDLLFLFSVSLILAFIFIIFFCFLLVHFIGFFPRVLNWESIFIFKFYLI